MPDKTYYHDSYDTKHLRCPHFTNDPSIDLIPTLNSVLAIDFRHPFQGPRSYRTAQHDHQYDPGLFFSSFLSKIPID